MSMSCRTLALRIPAGRLQAPVLTSKPPEGGAYMPIFRYSVSDAAGVVTRGTIDAESADAARRSLRQQGQFVIDIGELRSVGGDINIGPTRIGLRDVSVFTRQFSTMLASGITALRCLDILHGQAQNKRLKTVLHSCYEGIQKGQSLSESMQACDGAFPPILIRLVEAGEASGSLDDILARSADHFEKDYRIRRSATSAMVYPIILGILTITVVIFLLAFVIPTFSNMYASAGAALPLPTRILIAMSTFIW